MTGNISEYEYPTYAQKICACMYTFGMCNMGPSNVYTIVHLYKKHGHEHILDIHLSKRKHLYSLLEHLTND